MTDSEKCPIFGKTIYRNRFASSDNPRQYGIYVRTVVRRGKLNAGTWYEMTDGRGDFWLSDPTCLENDGDSPMMDTNQLATLTTENTKLAGTVDDVHWALWKLDDKPHQAWTRLMAIAQEAGDTDGTEACRLMLALDMTPERIVELAGIVRAVGSNTSNFYSTSAECVWVACGHRQEDGTHATSCPIGQAEAWVAEHPAAGKDT